MVGALLVLVRAVLVTAAVLVPVGVWTLLLVWVAGDGEEDEEVGEV